MKKVGFGKAKTDTNANRKHLTEPNASSFIIKDTDILESVGSIPGTLPSANSSIANVYMDSVSGALETTEDGASSDNRTWKTGVTNWIPPQFGSTYQLKVYAALVAQTIHKLMVHNYLKLVQIMMMNDTIINRTY